MRTSVGVAWGLAVMLWSGVFWVGAFPTTRPAARGLKAGWPRHVMGDGEMNDAKFDYAREIIEQHERAKKKLELKQRAERLWVDGTMRQADADATGRTKPASGAASAVKPGAPIAAKPGAAPPAKPGAPVGAKTPTPASSSPSLSGPSPTTPRPAYPGQTIPNTGPKSPTPSQIKALLKPLDGRASAGGGNAPATGPTVGDMTDAPILGNPPVWTSKPPDLPPTPMGQTVGQAQAAVGISTKTERGLSAAAQPPKYTLENFLGDCSTLGPMRFVIIGTGAILEAAGEFANMRRSVTPRGELLTFAATPASPAATSLLNFELHLKPDEVHSIEMVEKVIDPTKKLLILRFRGSPKAAAPGADAKAPASNVLLSAIMKVGGDDASAPGCVKQWYSMREKYGDSWVIMPGTK